VNELGLVTAEAFVPLGFAAEFVPSRDAELGSHLFLRRGPGGQRPVLLVTHLDTVFPPDEEAKHDFRWRPAPAEGRIYGPGTVDIKGGTAMIWLVFAALAEIAPEVLDAHHWLIAANASEETMSADFAARTIERCPVQSGAAQAVLVFEGGTLKGREFTLVTARKGKADYRINASGRAAHAGSFHAEGRNAIVALANLVPRLAALSNYHDELTVNVGTFHGGTVVNRVPHDASLELEMRAFRPDILRRAQDVVESLAGASSTVADTVIAVEKTGETAGWPGDGGTQSLFNLFGAVAADQCATAIAERRGGLSDANYLSILGPTLDGLGPSGGSAHCSERSSDGLKTPEFVETHSFIPKAALISEALGRLRAC
jgi:glutamate carboxypeptidase